MPDPAPQLPMTEKVAPAQRLYVRFYVALLVSLLVAAFLFGLAHLRFDPVQAGLAVVARRPNAMGFVAMLTVIALVVAAGAYPVVRRLTLRLERLQHSVEAWGDGALSTRVAVEGKDEVARLAASFNHSAARIESLVGAQKTLLANASHELRSPLARIRMAAELMAAQATPAIGAELRRNVAELDQLIDEVLLASRLDAVGASMPRVEDVDLTGLLAEECARANATLDAGAHSVQGDARLLCRMVRNLLENASRYGAGSPVEVRLGVAEASLRLDVCDGGPGIAESERERIFEPFYRLAGASEAAGGVGLGLSLVRQIARHHGGDAQCLSNGDGGCCFRVTLPYPR
jgi:signal transduction histidine kinase